MLMAIFNFFFDIQLIDNNTRYIEKVENSVTWRWMWNHDQQDLNFDPFHISTRH